MQTLKVGQSSLTVQGGGGGIHLDRGRPFRKRKVLDLSLRNEALCCDQYLLSAA